MRTLYACVAEHETELSFEPNQIITSGELVSLIKLVPNEIIFFPICFPSVRPSLEPGWLEGCLDGKLGLIPENYVEYIT